MVVLKQLSDGKWYVCRRAIKLKSGERELYYPFFIPRYTDKGKKGVIRSSGMLVMTPSKFIGKKIMLIVKEVENGTNKIQ